MGVCEVVHLVMVVYDDDGARTARWKTAAQSGTFITRVDGRNRFLSQWVLQIECLRLSTTYHVRQKNRKAKKIDNRKCSR